MAVYSKPNYSIGVWAQDGTMYTPTSEKISLGHVVERPPFEIVNFVENRQDQAIAYLFQVGIATWDKNTTYTTQGFTSYNGNVYQAISQNSDKQPDLNKNIWKLKWASSDDFESLKAIVNSIRTTEGYLGLYVSKANPVMTGKCSGVAYTANVGLNSSGSLKVGYGFNTKLSDGIFHNGTNTVVQKNGSVIAVFNPDVDVTKSSTDVVTVKDLQKYMQQYRVGDLYITTSTINPSVALGYGQWRRYAEGKAIVGASEQNSDPSWTRGVGSTYGEYDHKLTIDEMPRHRHDIDISGQDTGNAERPDGTSRTDARNYVPTEYEGGDKAHNNVQPSIVVCIWLRTA